MRTKSLDNEAKRRNQIIDSCKILYEERGFRDITIKDISQVLDISRPAIYKYYETKEEIFLDLIIREARLWLEDIKKQLSVMDKFSKEEFAALIASSFTERKTLLKILSMNIYEIEDNSRIERLTEYKNGFKEMNEVLLYALGKVQPKMSSKKCDRTIRLFLPFLNGVYAYSEPTKKQWEAMKSIGLEYKAPDIYGYLYEFLIELL